MKNLTIKLLLSVLVLTTGSALAMAPQTSPEVMAAIVELYKNPQIVDFVKAKGLINAISNDKINEVEGFSNGNLLYTVNSRYKQFKDPRYLEIINLLKSKGAEEKEFETVYIRKETGEVIHVDPKTHKFIDKLDPQSKTPGYYKSGTYVDPRTNREIQFDAETETIIRPEKLD